MLRNTLHQKIFVQDVPVTALPMEHYHTVWVQRGVEPQGLPAGKERPDMSAADRVEVVAGLIALQQRLGSGTPLAHLQADIDRLLAEFMSTPL
jgi:hypothetical protein